MRLNKLIVRLQESLNLDIFALACNQTLIDIINSKSWIPPILAPHKYIVGVSATSSHPVITSSCLSGEQDTNRSFYGPQRWNKEGYQLHQTGDPNTWIDDLGNTYVDTLEFSDYTMSTGEVLGNCNGVVDEDTVEFKNTKGMCRTEYDDKEQKWLKDHASEIPAELDDVPEAKQSNDANCVAYKDFLLQQNLTDAAFSTKATDMSSDELYVMRRFITLLRISPKKAREMLIAKRPVDSEYYWHLAKSEPKISSYRRHLSMKHRNIGKNLWRQENKALNLTLTMQYVLPGTPVANVPKVIYLTGPEATKKPADVNSIYSWLAVQWYTRKIQSAPLLLADKREFECHIDYFKPMVDRKLQGFAVVWTTRRGHVTGYQQIAYIKTDEHGEEKLAPIIKRASDAGYIITRRDMVAEHKKKHSGKNPYYQVISKLDATTYTSKALELQF